MKANINETLTLPTGVTATLADRKVTIKGPKGELSRELNEPAVDLKATATTITLTCKKATKKELRVINSFIAHIHNMEIGVQTPYKYKLKICSGHFPMNVSISGDIMSVKNFLGEKSPRTLKLKKGVTTKVNGEFIDVESADKDLAGQQASDIEALTAKSNRDLRVFQDGIYMIEKAGEKV